MKDILSSRKVLFALICCFTAIAAVDALLPGRIFFPDENFYIGEACSIAETGSLVGYGFYRAFGMPLTGMIYSIFYKLFGGGAVFIRSVRIFQAFLHILTAIGGASIAYSIFKNRCTALIVLFAVIVYPSLLAYQATTMSETIFTFFLVWGMAFLYMWRGGCDKIFVAAVFTMMLSLYTKAVITTLIPVLIAARSLFVTDSWRERVKYTLISCVLFIVCVTPWWIRNWSVFGEFVPFTTSASWNLYLGNNPVNKHVGVDWNTDVDLEKVREIHALNDELLISKAFSEEAKSYIMANKAEFVRNAWLKFKRFWNFQSNYEGDKYSLAFRLYNLSLLLSWGIACPLGLFSVFLSRKKWKELLPIFLLVLYYTFIHIVVIASLRYRLPIEPFFIILGADCLTRLRSGSMPFSHPNCP
ncbi:MAG: hypothetical protein LBS53_02355 [Synergistaceae bacterium]|jgi:hypothetical protein|nr:hypothetical protein [Synergistaceae bacterium]